MTINSLRSSYLEATKGNNALCQVIHRLRQDGAQYNCLRSEMLSIFENSVVWERMKSGDGHATFKNAVTGVVVGFQAHGKENTLKANQAIQLRDGIQTHLNILCNEVFQYKTKNWKTEPNYDEALKNYQNWKNS